MQEEVRTEEEIIDGVKCHRVTAYLDGNEVFGFSNELRGWRVTHSQTLGSDIETAKALIRLAQRCIETIEGIKHADL